MMMTKEQFAEEIRAGIPDVLPEPMPYDTEINHAPKRKDILTKEEKKLALRNALRYFPKKFHATLAPEFAEELEKGHDVLLEIDWQGALQVKRLFPDVVGIFILPPSVDALRARLNKRGTDSDEVIARRLAGAGAEMVHAGEFDYVIINDDFDRATGDLIAVVRASRLSFKTQAVRERETFKHLGIPLLN